MDEENVGFAIPANTGAADGAVQNGDFIMSFANEAGDKAVVLTSVEVLNGEVLEQHTRGELEGYAQGLMEGEPDEMDLQIGDIYEGETAAADADAEATRLDDLYNPGEGATDEDLMAAVEEARSDTTVAEENELAEAEDSFPLDLDEGEDIDLHEPGVGAEDIETESDDIEDEPIFDQLKRAKR